MASAYDKASLVMLPHATKEGKLYSVKPEDRSGDFTFSRGTSATRVNASGLIEKERGNLLLQSNTFSSGSWSKTNVSVTGGQAGYDGSSDAWLVEGTGSSVFSYLLQSDGTASVKTRSVYAKAGSVPYLGIWGAGSNFGYFDLSDGSLDLISGSFNITHSITSVGGGWYRCEFTTTGSSANFYLVPSSTANGTSLSAGENIYIQDAQLEEGLVATDYIETTTAAVYEGITDNLPRLDYSGGASCPSLLLEPSRTNFLLHSEYFGYWSVSNLTATANSIDSVEGNQNAYLISSTGSGNHPIYRGTSCANGDYTMSVFLKKGAVTAFSSWEDGYSTTGIQVNLDEVSVTPKNANTLNPFIEPYDNGWYRVGYSFSNTSGIVQPALYLQDASGNTNHTANGETIYMYGAQLEAGSYPTSYIPTYGTAASRADDNVNSLTSVSNLIGQTEGTIFIETSHIDEQAGDVRIQLSVGTSTNNWIFFGVPEATGGDYKARMYINNGGVNQVNRFSSALSSGNHKYALAYKENDVVLYVDGELQASDTLATIPACDRLTINGASPSSSASQAQNKYKQVALFKTRLTNAELAALTTI
jgi:hypothetical protein